MTRRRAWMWTKALFAAPAAWVFRRQPWAFEAVWLKIALGERLEVEFLAGQPALSADVRILIDHPRRRLRCLVAGRPELIRVHIRSAAAAERARRADAADERAVAERVIAAAHRTRSGARRAVPLPKPIVALVREELARGAHDRKVRDFMARADALARRAEERGGG